VGEIEKNAIHGVIIFLGNAIGHVQKAFLLV
jgi:hypothetical protein